MNKFDEILTLMRFYRRYETFINGVLADDDDFLSLINEIIKNDLKYQTTCDGLYFDIEF